MKDVLFKIRGLVLGPVMNQVQDQVYSYGCDQVYDVVYTQVYNLVWHEVSNQVLVRAIKHINDQVAVENYEKNQ
jgi:hypothetical protein